MWCAGITLFQAMLQVVRAAEEARQEERAGSSKGLSAASGVAAVGAARAGAAGDSGRGGGGRKEDWALASPHAALQAQARQLYRLVYQVRIQGLDDCLSLLSCMSSLSSTAPVGLPSLPSAHASSCAEGVARADGLGRNRRSHVWLEERPLDVHSGAAHNNRAHDVHVHAHAHGARVARVAEKENDVLEQRLSAAGLSEAAFRAVRVLAILYRHEPALPHSSVKFLKSSLHSYFT